MRGNRAGALEAGRIIDSNLERQGGDGPHTGNGHHPHADLILCRRTLDPPIQFQEVMIETDRDVVVYHRGKKSRLGRIGFAFQFWLKKLVRSWTRIWTRGHEVELPVWQRLIAMLYSFGFFTIMLFGQLYSAVSRSFEPLPAVGDKRKPATAD